jgi:C-terminal processing protease CtpA/Prc
MGIHRSWGGWCLALPLLIGLCSCGGSSGGGAGDGTGSSAGWVAGVFQPSSHYINQCQTPRTGNDPYTGKAFPDVQGSTLDEKNFLRSWTNELYLWYDEVTDVDPSSSQYPKPTDYFAILKTMQMTSTGAEKDRFHFTELTSAYEGSSRAGIDVGYGLNWALVARVPPRQVYVADVWPGTLAASAGLIRGDEVMSIDGVDMINSTDQASINTLNAGLSPSTPGESHTFVMKSPVTGATSTVTLQAAQVTETPVPVVKTIPTSNGLVGYMLFNSHIATAEQELVDGINQLKTAGVTDLVLDIRYNGGGYLDIASDLAYMIAGPVPTAGQPFDQIAFSKKYPSTNPVTGQPLAPTPFHTTMQGFAGDAAGTALPYLGLPRVYVLTSADTCSASEAVINGLKGVNIQVIQIGSTTCGKPYGFYPQDDCGTTYFSIEFQGDNAAGFGSYSDGFSPQNSTHPTNATLPGCSVADDFTHQLGDPAEGILATALAYRSGSACPAASGTAPPSLAVTHLKVHRSTLRENLLLSH